MVEVASEYILTTNRSLVSAKRGWTYSDLCDGDHDLEGVWLEVWEGLGNASQLSGDGKKEWDQRLQTNQLEMAFLDGDYKKINEILGGK